MERKNARTPGRSALAQRFATVEATLTGGELQGNGDGLDDFAEDGFRGLGLFLQRGVPRAGDHAVRKNRYRELLEIVRKAEIAAIEKSASLRGALQHQSAARADPEGELLGFARARDDFQRVIVQAGIHFDLRDAVLHGEHVAYVGDWFERANRIVANAHAQDFALRFVRGVAHADAHEEAIELRFRERVSTVVLDGILRGDDEKRLGQRERFAVHGHLRFVHGFQQRGLRARGGAVDFVGEYDIGKNGAGAKFKFAGLGIVDADAEHVAGQQVGSELDALAGTMKRFRESLREGGLADAGNVFDEQVAAGEQGDQRELDGFFLAVDGLGDGTLQLRNGLRGGSRHC